MLREGRAAGRCPRLPSRPSWFRPLQHQVRRTHRVRRTPGRGPSVPGPPLSPCPGPATSPERTAKAPNEAAPSTPREWAPFCVPNPTAPWSPDSSARQRSPCPNLRSSAGSHRSPPGAQANPTIPLPYLSEPRPPPPSPAEARSRGSGGAPCCARRGGRGRRGSAGARGVGRASTKRPPQDAPGSGRREPAEGLRTLDAGGAGQADLPDLAAPPPGAGPGLLTSAR